jgi:hypothetical protein
MGYGEHETILSQIRLCYINSLRKVYFSHCLRDTGMDDWKLFAALGYFSVLFTISNVRILYGYI